MSEEKLLLGIDLGTTNCKGIVFSPSKGILGESSNEFKLITQKQDYVEQNANEWWNIVVKTLRSAVKNSNISPKQIHAISISSQGISFVPVDKNMKPLYNIISWLDTRAKEQTKKILNKFDFSTMFRITGKRIHPTYVLPKLLWLKDNKPKIFKDIYKFLMGMDYLTAKLTGEFITDHTMAAGTLMYDINSLNWSSKILNEFSIPRDKLPELKWSGEKVGYVCKKASEETGLDTKTLVMVGAQDQKCAALAAGLDKGIATLSLGTAGAIIVQTNKPVIDSVMRIPCFPYLRRNKWILEAVISTTGASIEWISKIFSSNVDIIEQVAEKSDAGSNGLFFFPHLSGATSPHWNEKLKGAFCGISLSTTKSDFYRAILEGIAYEIKTNIDVIESLGIKIKKIHVFGGGAKSILWLNIIASVLNREIIKSRFIEGTASLGACLLAASGSNLYKNIAKGKVLEYGQKIYPCNSLVQKYRELYQRYSELSNKLVK